MVSSSYNRIFLKSVNNQAEEAFISACKSSLIIPFSDLTGFSFNVAKANKSNSMKSISRDSVFM